ncbi:mannan endo-1,4-beta-mannosidase [Psychrosphaera sp. B3R10]|uniref:glycosyl hydrolase n=1 Tax=unclassified Psychrosphaera TaxID=2641570 RepID=UPI001C0942E3|nr:MULTISPECIES: glycosyl hydrolase [unclassified Psychrosphaera]MBU2880551.1 mannan endo-1,4-beta-mannosidase [Psychrosphaera sp. I2R16]MBU2989128.1 mannan endo-1,4-beta-mannosidase [Psychrosphaera sp. B3R10]MDO6717784.1 glycosyl hydrolase [Psychrosphaera sp. 1_MG-2023]
MSVLLKNKSVGALIVAVSLSGLLSGCGIEEAKLNTDTVEYTPEERPLGVIAGEGAEYEPGSKVLLSGRLVGTVTDQTVLWTQTAGTPITGITDWSSTELSFIAPNILGIESFTFEISARESDGTAAVDADGNPLVDIIEIVVFDPATKVFYEVEDDSIATLAGVELVSAGEDGYLNGASGSHTLDIIPGASVTYNITMEQDTFVTLYAAFGIPASGYGSKNAVITVNGVGNEFTVDATGNFSEYRIGVVKLNAGNNVIEVSDGWNYYRFDYLMTVPAAQPAGPLAVPADLVNPNATAATVSLMEYLTSNYGTATLSGQTEYPTLVDGHFPLTEFDKIVTATNDDAPAIVAFDYLDFSATRASHTSPQGLTEDMIAAHNDKNVILSALFHWNAPTDIDEENWWQGFYTQSEGYPNGTTFDLAAALADKTGANYAALIADIDTVSLELKKFTTDMDIPILWRPLHEAEGGWFWWGAAGPDALKELWIIMYDRMTNHHGLNNLIWVYTHARDLDTEWYPGDMYVDIVGYDGYAEPTNNASDSFQSQYSKLKDRHNGKKLVALTETGTIPDIAVMHEQNAWWSFFITWNSNIWEEGDDIGPDGAEATIIDANYAYEGVINLADIPGGRSKTEAGLFEGFEVSTANFEAQINWSPTTGIATSDKWAASGTRALTLVKDLSAEAELPTGVMFQMYPAGGLDVTDVTAIKVSGNAINSGAGTTIKFFIKHGDDWVWVDSGAVSVVDGGVEIEIDVTEFDWLAGFGFQIEGFEATSTAAEFYLDNVRLDDTVIYDFEPDTSGFESQINWSGVPGLTVTSDWSASGNKALTMIKDLSVLTEPTGAMFQAYPEGGIDVSDVTTVKVSGHAIGAGVGVTVKLFVKHGDDWEWADSGAVTIIDGGVELTVDVTEFDWLAGLGFQYEGIDASATDARFYLDNVRLDDKVIYDFEGTNNWEFQVNWTPTAGLLLATDWAAQGENSLVGTAQLVDGDDDVILQTYPAGGLLLGDVTMLKVTALAANAGDAVQVQLFAKDKEGVWRDSGAVDLASTGTELMLDISDMGEISGFGVRFMGAVNNATESKYYVDNITFE